MKPKHTGARINIRSPARPAQPTRLYNLAPNSVKLSNAPPLKISDLTMVPDANEVLRNGKQIKLCKKEYQLLEFLAHHKNKVISRNTLLEYVWNYNVHSNTNTLEVHMAKLRRKIDGDYSNKIIETVYGTGYKLCDRQAA